MPLTIALHLGASPAMAQAKAPCLVPGPHYSSQPKRFGSRDPSENAKGLGKRRTGTTRDRDWTLQGLDFTGTHSRPQSSSFLGHVVLKRRVRDENDRD